MTQGTSSLEFEGLLRVPFDAPRAGTLEGEIEWTHATNGILVIVTNGVCTFDQLFAEQCSLISMSLGTAPKPRRFSLAGRAAGPYTMFIGNLGPDDEGVAYQVVLHPSAAAASAANPAHVASPETIDLHRFTRLIELP